MIEHEAQLAHNLMPGTPSKLEPLHNEIAFSEVAI
jgi:hypothetical protein